MIVRDLKVCEVWTQDGNRDNTKVYIISVNQCSPWKSDSITTNIDIAIP